MVRKVYTNPPPPPSTPIYQANHPTQRTTNCQTCGVDFYPQLNIIINVSGSYPHSVRLRK